jgi:hypothetical protein
MEFKERMARWQVLADLWILNNKKVFIKDISNNYYFADIKSFDQLTITIKCFAPADREDKDYQICWADIITFEEYWGKN